MKTARKAKASRKPVVKRTLEQIIDRVVDEVSGKNEPDEAVRDLRRLTRSKDKVIQGVSMMMAAERAVGSMKEALRVEVEKGEAVTAQEKQDFQHGLEASQAVPTETSDEPQHSEQTMIAHTADSINGTATPSSNGQVIPIREGQPSEQHQPQKRVRWSIDEQTLVCARAAERLRADGVGFMPDAGDRRGTVMLVSAMDLSQRELLPPDRCKKIIHRHSLESAGLIAPLKHALKEAHKPRLHLPPTPETEPVAPPPASSATTPPFASTSTPPFAPPPTYTRTELPPMTEEEKADPILAATNALMLALRVQFREMKDIREMNAIMISDFDGIVKRLEVAEAHIRSIEKVERKEEAQVKAALPTVALLGMRKDVFDQIVQKAAEQGLKLDFRHYEQGSKPRPVNAQWALSMRFISHAWEDHAKSSVPPGHFGYTSGSVSSVIAQLELWFNEAQNEG